MNKLQLCVLAATACVISQPSALGQDAPADDAAPETIAPPAASDTSFTLEVFGQYLGEGDVEGPAGDVDITRLGGSLGFRHSLSDSTVLIGSVLHEWSDYDFDRAGTLFPGASNAESPFDDLHETALTLGISTRLDNRWSLFARGIIGAGYENGADFDDSIVGGGFGGFGYKFSDEFSLSLGLGVLTRLEDDELIVPLIGFRWQIQDDLRLESEGLAANLIWETNDDLELRAFGRYTSRSYRMDDSNDYLPGGAFSDDRFIVGAGADWAVADQITLSIEVGASVWQEYEFFNSSGDKISTRETDPQLMVRAGFEYRF